MERDTTGLKEIPGLERSLQIDFSEDELRLRRVPKRFRNHRDKNYYPRFPPKIPRYCIFIDRRNNERLQAHLDWINVPKCPRLIYIMCGKAIDNKKYGEKGPSGFGWYIASTSKLKRMFPKLMYRRYFSNEKPTTWIDSKCFGE